MIQMLDYFVAILTILYALLLMAYRYWYSKLSIFKPTDISAPKTQFSIIIPARNEAANIKACVESILAQDYPKEAFEIIVMDDFSEDDTARENIGTLKNGPGELWYLQGVQTVGQFPAADPKTFTEPVNEFVNQMAAITSTPTHYFMRGSYIPSGQALRVSEAPLTKKILNRQMALESTWRDLFLFMLKIEGISAAIDIDWSNAETIDEVDRWDVAVRKKSVGMPLEQILLELGYDAELATQISAESMVATGTTQDISLQSTGVNANNLAVEQSAAERNNQIGQ